MSAANGRKSIFVTGAASGMGREVARLFQEKGWFVGAFDVNADGLEALKAELGAENGLYRRLDVSDRADYQAAIAAFGAATGGTMDILHNNAGVGRFHPFATQPFEEVMKIVNTNFVGVLIGIHEALPLLKKTPGALCFTTSSSSATFGMPNIAVYSATKHAVKGLTESLSVEFKAFGIKVADTLPGLIDTAMMSRESVAAATKTGMFRAIHPIEIAKVVWEAYNSDTLHFYVPPELFELDKVGTLNPEQTRDGMASGALFATLNASTAD
jgi:NAD(P)-dependent dehydrogenase (short-subunit alcohol dehydrogenase family)